MLIGASTDMPIKPENKNRYPADWAQIRERIRARAGDKCEWCDVYNHALGGRLADGTFVYAHAKEQNLLRDVYPKPGEEWWCGPKINDAWLRIIRIVCTVAHLNHTVEDCSDENLRFLCQRCHLRHDLIMHQQHAYQTRREGKAIDMFEVCP
jgi:hypothetical protein